MFSKYRILAKLCVLFPTTVLYIIFVTFIRLKILIDNSIYVRPSGIHALIFVILQKYIEFLYNVQPILNYFYLGYESV